MELYEINNEQNRKLLYKYLVQDYLKYGNTLEEAKIKAKKSIEQGKSNLFGKNGVAVRLGRRSLEFFALFFLQSTFLPNEENGASPIAPIHSEIWQQIEDAVLKNEIDKLGFILPRGTGKSAFGTFAAGMWVMCYRLRSYALICSNTGDNAEKFIKQVKTDLLENPYIKAGFGELLVQNDKRYVVNSSHIDLVNGCSIESISAKSSMRGRKNTKNLRPDFIVLDDYQDSETDIRSEEGRQKKWDTFSSDVKFVGQRPVIKDGKVLRHGTLFIALGTLQHEQDIYGRLMSLPTWKFTHRKGVLVDDLEELFNTGLWLEFKKILYNKDDDLRLENAKEFYWQHEKEMQYPLLWQSYWDCLQMAMDYYDNPEKFEQEIQGNIKGIGQRKFKTIVTMPPDKIEELKFEKTMLCIDPAGNDNKTKNTDYYAFCTGSITASGIKYVRKGELFRFNFDDYIRHTLELLKKYKDITHIYIEKNTYLGVDVSRIKEFMEKDEDLRYRDIEFINEMQKRNKEEKISTIYSECSNGVLVFNEEDIEFIDQIKQFSGCQFSTHDDSCDITAEFSNRIIEINVPGKITLLNRKLLGI